jgi:hypothetical protein
MSEPKTVTVLDGGMGHLLRRHGVIVEGEIGTVGHSHRSPSLSSFVILPLASLACPHTTPAPTSPLSHTLPPTHHSCSYFPPPHVLLTPSLRPQMRRFLGVALANEEQPDLVRQSHTEYLEAGAQVITTNTYR